MRYLFEANGTIYTFADGQWQDTGLIQPLTEEDYDTQGMTIEVLESLTEDDLNFLGDHYTILHADDVPDDKIDDVNLYVLTPEYIPIEQIDSPTVVCYDPEYAAERKLSVTCEPHDQVVLANDDIHLSHVENILNFTVTANVPEGEYLGVIFSNDSGETWYGWDTEQGDFVKIDDVTNKEEVREKSASVEEFNAISEVPERWYQFVFAEEPEIIRFGYYMTPGVANDNLSMTVDLKGQYKSMGNRIDYDWQFASNELITLDWYGGEGTIKINYVDGK